MRDGGVGVARRLEVDGAGGVSAESASKVVFAAESLEPAEGGREKPRQSDELGGH